MSDEKLFCLYCFVTNLCTLSYAFFGTSTPFYVYSLFKVIRNGILLRKLFRPTMSKNYCSDREKLLKFEAEGREFTKFLRSLEQFIQTVKGQKNFW